MSVKGNLKKNIENYKNYAKVMIIKALYYKKKFWKYLINHKNNKKNQKYTKTKSKNSLK
jgi:flagellar biosynthesis regulator FlaF